jgi:Polyprenyl synthetase
MMAETGISRETLDEVQRRLRRTVRALAASGGPHAAADRAVAEAVTGFLDRVEGRGSRPALDGILALPLLVHGAHTGDPRPAVPAATAHLLWWVSARYLDDLADAPGAADQGPAKAEADRMLLAVIGVACHLSAALLDEACAGDRERALLLRQELSRCWHSALSGQLVDLAADPTLATADEVLAGYRGKTGAPYAMSAAMGAIFAGCDAARVEAWREFGERFGVLRQLVNDQRDLAGGRYEDLRNRTATFMLVHYLGSLPEAERRDAESLLAQCADGAEARGRLAARLTEPDRLRGFAAAVQPLIAGLHASIAALGGEPGFVQGLHGLVEETVLLQPAFLLAGQNA